MAPTIIAFDLYGTLLSTDSIAKELSAVCGNDKAKTIAIQARGYQLEYTWRINGMGLYQPFGELTRWSFRHAAADAGVQLSPEHEERILHAYNGLDTFPEVDQALAILTEISSFEPYIFSNGTKAMITSSLRTSPSLSRASSIFPESRVISVDPLRLYKPDRRTYEHFVRVTQMESHLDKVWLVSSNPFDVAGAAAVGLKSAWVDRAGSGWIDGLGGATGISPTIVVRGVDDAVLEISRHVNEV